jgi:hypothetical protein
MAISEKLRNDIYDFKGCIRALLSKQDSYILNEIKNSLNRLFGLDGCKQVIYTENHDKMFFGVCVMPIIPAKNIINIIQNDDKYIISEYYLELDSKLFDSGMALSYDEISAIILHEVSHLVTDSTPMELVKNNIDNYLLQRNETIKLTDSIHYIEILSYGIRDALRKVTSIFEAEENEIIDQFDIDCGNSELLKSAMSKISCNGYNVNSPIDNKIVVLSWVMRLYKDVLHNRIAAIHTLKKGMEITASKLEHKEMSNIIRRLERIDDDVLISESFIDDIAQVFKRNVNKMKLNGIKSYEDDFYEIEFNVNNMETQDDAVLLLHQINSRMAVIDDFLTSEELDRVAYKRWMDLYNKYNNLRSTISKNKIYQNKTRLYVNYGFDN